MKKILITCDACQQQINEHEHHKELSLGKHLLTNPTKNHVIMHNGSAEGTSGIDVKIDLCISCYNKIGYAAVDKLKEIQKSVVVPKPTHVTIYENTNQWNIDTVNIRIQEWIETMRNDSLDKILVSDGNKAITIIRDGAGLLLDTNKILAVCSYTDVSSIIERIQGDIKDMLFRNRITVVIS